MSELFPVTKSFTQSRKSESTVILNSDIQVFGKSLRKGAIVKVLGYRDIAGLQYLILSKGTWEGIVLYEEIRHVLESCLD